MTARLPAVRPREVLRALERDGWAVRRQRGSHVLMAKAGRKTKVVVPLHNRDMPRGTLTSILADAELTAERFIELLKS